jgi:hypothetical protein
MKMYPSGSPAPACLKNGKILFFPTKHTYVCTAISHQKPTIVSLLKSALVFTEKRVKERLVTYLFFNLIGRSVAIFRRAHCPAK